VPAGVEILEDRFLGGGRCRTKEKEEAEKDGVFSRGV